MKKTFAMLLTAVLALSVAGSAMAKHHHHGKKAAKEATTETSTKTEAPAKAPAKKK